MFRLLPAAVSTPAHRRILPAFAALATAVFTGLASFGATSHAADEVPLDTLFARAATPTSLRATLAAWGEERATTEPEASGEAWYWIGESYYRQSQPDSAILAWERAWARRRGGLEADALVEALFERKGADDLDRAHTVAAARVPLARASSEVDHANALGRLAWSLVQRSQADSAAKMFARAERRLLSPTNSMRWIWQLRIAHAELAHGNVRRSLDLATPVAARNLLKDFDALDLLADATPGGASRAAPLIRNEMRLLIEERAGLVAAMKGSEVWFPSADGEPLSGIVIAPEGRGRARAAVAFVGTNESFDAWDSLATALRHAGVALILVEPRGTGSSRTKQFPSPESWRGFEDQLERETGREARAALRALALATPVDTSRFLVLAAGEMVGCAIEAARADSRVLALMLTSPDPSPVARGRVLAELGAVRPPVFIEVVSTDLNLYFMNVADLFLHAANESASRSADSRHMGPGVMVFRNDPEAFPRFKRWLDETWKLPPRSATPRKRPR
ncbi:MAG: hypothetical protein HOP12_14710 [Candidatus Eisenbacteria bacterium]|uniref:Alpha/beta hydrolase n=1 Tax=Eiseniibacteriota bacterium TaxID=2212470 RepID=A0A849SNL0_UNCEI|nr:hypothetical protein [Candidatus Eisenbacteria bacterium]